MTLIWYSLKIDLKGDGDLSCNYHLDNLYINNPLNFDRFSISQIGRMYCQATTEIDTHIHTNLYELTVVTEGKGIVTTNGMGVPVQKGDIYIYVVP